MIRAEWLPGLLENSFNEIYEVEPSTFRILYANPAACCNLRLDQAQLLGKSLAEIIAPQSLPSIRTILAAPFTGASTVVDVTHIRADKSQYPAKLKFITVNATDGATLLVIGTDVSKVVELERAVVQSETRFQAITSNTPGLVYQFRLRPDSSVEFPYLSEGCHALLGISSERLCRDASLFTALILPEDREAYHSAMQASAQSMKSWNWEGRIWVEEWKDIKWINLRSTPQLREDGCIQWDGIMANITQSKMEEAEVRRSREQLAELSDHIQTVKEQERTRIAREIHDDLGGNLTAIKMALSLLARRLPANDGALSEKAAYVDTLVDRTIESVHRIAGDLRPSILDLGLVAAIEWQAKEFEKQWGIPCSLASNKAELDFPADQATALFRVFQEALTNIGKHAHASRVEINLSSGKSGLRLEINDDGRGIDAADCLKPKSFGIRGMKERIAALGGELSVARGITAGTVVSVRIPPDAA